MERKLSDSINLFDSNINKNYWADPNSNNILNVKNYSDLLFHKFEHVGSNIGRNDRYSYDISADYYYNRTNKLAVAQTTASKRNCTPNIDPTLRSKISNYGQINISTYIDANGSIASINRFDYKGHPHSNRYYIYSDEERELYEKYFTDFEINYTPMARNPHIHFETQEQALNLERSNAISLVNIINYLSDLLIGVDPKLEIFDLGMPFLKYYKNDITYANSFFNYLQQFVESDEADEIKDFMKDLIYKSRMPGDDIGQNLTSPPTDDGNNDTGGGSIISRAIRNVELDKIPLKKAKTGKISLMQIRRDLIVYMKLYDKFRNNTNVMVHLAKVLINSISFNQSLNLEFNKELFYEF